VTPRRRRRCSLVSAHAVGRTRPGRRAQLAVNDRQVSVAAELTTEAPDFGHLDPTVRAARRELRAVDVDERATAVADAGYWHQRQIETVISDGIQVLVPPDSGLRTAPRPGWTGALYDFMRRLLATPVGRAGYGLDRSPSSLSWPADVQPPDQTLPTPGASGLPVGMAAHRSHPQSPQAPQPPPRGHHLLRRRPPAACRAHGGRHRRVKPAPADFSRLPPRGAAASGRRPPSASARLSLPMGLDGRERFVIALPRSRRPTAFRVRSLSALPRRARPGRERAGRGDRLPTRCRRS